MNAREMIGVVAASGETAVQTAIRAAFKLGEESMRERCAKECDAMAANARPSCERNYTDGDAWVEAAANAIRALPVEE